MTLDTTPAKAAIDELQRQHVGLMGSMTTSYEQQLSDVRDVNRTLNLQHAADLAEIDRLEKLLNPDALVQWVNWWCADGWRDGAPVLHHLEQFGADSPEVAAYRLLAQQVGGTTYSFDTSKLGRDAGKAEATKINDHKALLGVSTVQHIRVFFGTAPPTWTGTATEHQRIAALTEGDSFTFSSLSTDWAAWKRFYDLTPEKFRKFPGQVTSAFGHEREAELRTAALLQAWLDANARVADLLNNAEGYSTDDLVKIGLWFSQQLDKRPEVPRREQLYGGQDFGTYGEDCYSPRAWKRYATAEELVGPVTKFCQEIGRPCAIPEIGAERIPVVDPTGAGRTKLITDCAAYIGALG